MGLFTFIVNVLYSFGRAIERLSIRTGSGAFRNSGKGLCKDCFMESKSDQELCRDCRVYWLQYMAPSSAFHQRIDIASGPTLIVFGQSMFWLNILHEWEPPSEPMKALAAAIPLPLSTTHLDIFLKLVLALSILAISIPIMIALFIVMCKSPNPRQNKRGKAHAIAFITAQIGMFFFWVFYVGISLAELLFIVLPQINGYISLVLLVMKKMTGRSVAVDEERDEKELGQEKLG